MKEVNKPKCKKQFTQHCIENFFNQEKNKSILNRNNENNNINSININKKKKKLVSNFRKGQSNLQGLNNQHLSRSKNNININMMNLSIHNTNILGGSNYNSNNNINHTYSNYNENKTSDNMEDAIIKEKDAQILELQKELKYQTDLLLLYKKKLKIREDIKKNNIQINKTRPRSSVKRSTNNGIAISNNDYNKINDKFGKNRSAKNINEKNVQIYKYLNMKNNKNNYILNNKDNNKSFNFTTKNSKNSDELKIFYLRNNEVKVPNHVFKNINLHTDSTFIEKRKKPNNKPKTSRPKSFDSHRLNLVYSERTSTENKYKFNDNINNNDIENISNNISKNYSKNRYKNNNIDYYDLKNLDKNYTDNLMNFRNNIHNTNLNDINDYNSNFTNKNYNIVNLSTNLKSSYLDSINSSSKNISDNNTNLFNNKNFDLNSVCNNMLIRAKKLIEEYREMAMNE